MMTFADLSLVPSDRPAPFTDQLCLAVAAYLARFIGASRQHTESDLRCYLSWCAQRGLDPFTALRPALGAVHPVNARDPPLRALHRVAGGSPSWPGSTRSLVGRARCRVTTSIAEMASVLSDSSCALP
jgi:hypothetical protein